MKITTVYEARSRLPELIAEVSAGEEIVITDRGRPVARLIADHQSRRSGQLEMNDPPAGLPPIGLTVAQMREAGLL
jgi:antitoxin (DNA-binding transcriptional repressor) of toxin-antitoxin stability system